MKSLVPALFLFASVPAFASGHQCPTEQQRERLTAFRDQLAGAESPEAAREMALHQTHIDHVAIHKAAALLKDEDLQAEDQRLSAFEDGIRDASSQAEVASQFDQLMGGHLLRGCAYDSIEIVLIVVGFVLGIVPGIILLFLFC